MENRAALFLGTLGFVVLSISVSWSAPSVYDGFNYANDGSPLTGQIGGYGWAGPWSETGSGAGNQFLLSQNDTSLDLPNLPFEPVGDRVLATGPGGTTNDNRVSRPISDTFSLAADGTLYASFLFSKTGSSTATTVNNQEFVLLSGTAQTIRLGSTSTNQFWLGVASNTFGPITLSDTYFVVLRVDAVATGSDTLNMMVFDSTETVPATEPVSYDRTHTFTSSVTINGAQFWIGNNASGVFDEVRLGSTWTDVTSANPNFILGDFNGMDGITVADYHILRDNLFSGTTYEQGDMNFSGLVDLTDFAQFRQAYLNLGFSASDLDGPGVPEPISVVLWGIAGFVGAARMRRCRNARPARGG